MNTTSATIIRQTVYWGEEGPQSEELMRCYRHYGGYPEGHGIDLATSVMAADQNGVAPELWVQGVLSNLLNLNISLEFEPKGYEDGHIKYLYVVDGVTDQRWVRTKSGHLPITISIYEVGLDEDYETTMKRTPLFSGTAYELADKYPKRDD